MDSSLAPGSPADRLLDAMLAHVPFDGWSAAALARGAQDLGLDPALARNLFPRGPIDAIAAHSVRADRELVAAVTARDLAALRHHEKVALAVWLRLEQAEGAREAVRRATQFLALPGHGATALRLLYRTVDAVWAAVGDRSTDFSYYTKRALLAAVYSATLAFWLQDDSPGRQSTRAFLDRRLGEVLQLGRLGGRLGPLIAALPSPLGLVAGLRERALNPRRKG